MEGAMTWDRWIAVALLVLIFLAQAGSLVGLIRRRVDTDRGSAFAIVGAWYVVLVVSVLEAWRWPGLLPEPRWVPILGAGVFALGFWLRLVAVHTLDKHFSPLVELQPEHALVTHGPYAWVRHPAYLGSLMWSFAPPLLMGSALGLVAAVALYYPAMRYRVMVEERLLADRFGESWAAYRARVPALIPTRPPRPAS
jgi:protein-S-isoprenylcysteine O-methyltransferase Ste14